MRIVRVPIGDKRILGPLEKAWQVPNEQDIPTEDIIKWLRLNIHRPDVGLWIVLDKSQIKGALLALGPSLLTPFVHIYCGWMCRKCKINTKEFIETELTEWAKSQGAKDITMWSVGHTARVWQRRFGFVPFSRVYIKRLEGCPLPTENKIDNILSELGEAT